MKRLGRISELDGVRGITVLLAVLCHAVLYNPGSSDDRISAIRPFGHAGVGLFFVLSVFLITGILISAKGKPGYFRIFYAKRALRIWPLYYLLLFIAFALVPLLAHHAHVAEVPDAHEAIRKQVLRCTAPMHLDTGPSLHSISIGPASAANAGGFLQLVESKARKHATPCARLASSRFRFNTKT